MCDYCLPCRLPHYQIAPLCYFIFFFLLKCSTLPATMSTQELVLKLDLLQHQQQQQRQRHSLARSTITQYGLYGGISSVYRAVLRCVDVLCRRLAVDFIDVFVVVVTSFTFSAYVYCILTANVLSSEINFINCLCLLIRIYSMYIHMYSHAYIKRYSLNRYSKYTHTAVMHLPSAFAMVA